MMCFLVSHHEVQFVGICSYVDFGDHVTKMEQSYTENNFCFSQVTVLDRCSLLAP